MSSQRGRGSLKRLCLIRGEGEENGLKMTQANKFVYKVK